MRESGDSSDRYRHVRWCFGPFVDRMLLRTHGHRTESPEANQDSTETDLWPPSTLTSPQPSGRGEKWRAKEMMMFIPTYVNPQRAHQMVQK